MSSKAKLIDELNDAFIVFLRDYRGTRIATYIKNINTRIIEEAPNLSPPMIRRIVEEEALDLRDVAVFSMIIGAITAIIENRRMTKQQRDNLIPIIAAISVYSLSNPKRFVTKLHKSLKNPKSSNEKQVNKLLNDYVEKNQRVIERIQKEQLADLRRAQSLSKLDMTKSVVKDIERMTLEGKPLEMQRHWLKRKYNANKAITRAVDTEIHANIEKGKLLQAQSDGFTQKQWKTQGDDRVRRTRWHNHVANNTVDIDQDFRLGNMVASAPGDMRLPVGERINCRCYMIYK